VPDISCFQYFLNKIEETGMNGRVSCGHLTSLSAQGLSEMEAERAIEKAACLDLNVTSLTSCNLYLSSMNRSGPTRVRQFVQAGVNVAVASDNIRDTFRPYGNCDLLEEALLTAKVHRFGTPAELRQVFDMITYNGAKNALVNHYGIEPGYPANLVILDASTPEEALLFQAEKSVLVRNGKMLKNCNEITYN
jgi:cytosine deaminase